MSQKQTTDTFIRQDVDTYTQIDKILLQALSYVQLHRQDAKNLRKTAENVSK